MTTMLKENRLRPTAPDLMPAEERLKEVANILATGMARLMKNNKTEKNPLDKSPTIGPHGRKPTQGEDHE
ncbi:MAG: hypothetical protein HQL56_10225 [Magnetococcales bacterium]|nr:hypothetical protein [Magnetococcales bacterium]